MRRRLREEAVLRDEPLGIEEDLGSEQDSYPLGEF